MNCWGCQKHCLCWATAGISSDWRSFLCGTLIPDICVVVHKILKSGIQHRPIGRAADFCNEGYSLMSHVLDRYRFKLWPLSWKKHCYNSAYKTRYLTKFGDS